MMVLFLFFILAMACLPFFIVYAVAKYILSLFGIGRLRKREKASNIQYL